MDPHMLQPEVDRVSELHKTLADVNPALARVHPIAVVEDDHFTIFDLDPTDGQWAFVKRAPTPMPVPQGVRAAFPLECYDGRTACVVTSDVFDTLAGYVTLFHEFVHCHQAETCETALKETLRIAQAASDPMWEITYPFPYNDPCFFEDYRRFFGALAAHDPASVWACRSALKQHLASDDFEYLVWQEWKEGFARFIENRIRAELGLGGNHGGQAPPYRRVSFYEGGAQFIEFLEAQAPEISHDLEALFTLMCEGKADPLVGRER